MIFSKNYKSIPLFRGVFPSDSEKSAIYSNSIPLSKMGWYKESLSAEKRLWRAYMAFHQCTISGIQYAIKRRLDVILSYLRENYCKIFLEQKKSGIWYLVFSIWRTETIKAEERYGY